MDEKELAAQLKEFVEYFEENVESTLRSKGVSEFTWVHASDLDFDEVTLRGDCASQAGCGSSRCKDRIDPCIVRVCRRLHNCASNCQVATDCKVDYCHGKGVR